MATSSFARTLLGGVDASLKRVLGEIVDYLLNNSLAFGPIDTTTAQSKTTNFAGRYVKVTTHGTANTEAAIAHGLGRKPHVMWQVIPPSVVNARFIGDLTNSKAADENRIYLTSASTSATTWLMVE